MVINSDQDQFACRSDTDPGMNSNIMVILLLIDPYLAVAFNGCPFEIDSVWGITWPNTERNSSNVQLCPGGHDALGISCINMLLVAAVNVEVHIF